MASLPEQIDADFKTALRGRDADVVRVLRMVKSSLHNAVIAKGKALEEGEVLQVLRKEIKQRRESIEAFQKGNRADLTQQETREMAILERYLPSAPSETALDQAIARVIAAHGASGPKEMGTIMKALRDEFQGRVDGAVLAAKVKAKLGQ